MAEACWSHMTTLKKTVSKTEYKELIVAAFGNHNLGHLGAGGGAGSAGSGMAGLTKSEIVDTIIKHNGEYAESSKRNQLVGRVNAWVGKICQKTEETKVGKDYHHLSPRLFLNQTTSKENKDKENGGKIGP